MITPENLFVAMIVAGAIVLIVHINIWYYSLPKAERRRLDDEAKRNGYWDW